MVILIVLLIIAAALWMLFVYGTWFFTFHNSDARKNAAVDLPASAQYDPFRREMKALVDAMHEVPFEEVRIRAYDGTELYGRYYHARNNEPVDAQIEVRQRTENHERTQGKEHAAGYSEERAAADSKECGANDRGNAGYESSVQPLQIMFHGYRGAALRDMAGAHKIARTHGIDSLVVDQRAHENSGGHTIAFGIKEREDCKRWCEYAAERFGLSKPVIISGVSMGAATVLMAADLDLPSNVVGIAADCGYSSPKDIICDVIRQKKLPVWLFWPAAYLGELFFGHVNLLATSAKKAVSRTKLPILIIHGTEDRFVPCRMAEEIAAAYRGGMDKAGAGDHGACGDGACGDGARNDVAGRRNPECADAEVKRQSVQVEIFEGAPHGLSFLVDEKRYTETELAFIEKCNNKVIGY